MMLIGKIRKKIKRQLTDFERKCWLIMDIKKVLMNLLKLYLTKSMNKMYILY